LQANLSNSLDNIIEYTDQLDIDAVNASNQVITVMNRFRSMVDKREQELLKDIEEHRAAMEKKLWLDKEKVEHLLESMNHCRELTEALFGYGNPVEISSTSKAIEERLKTLLKSDLPSLPKSNLQYIEDQEKEKKKSVLKVVSSLGRIVSPIFPDIPSHYSVVFLDARNPEKLPLNQKVTAIVIVKDYADKTLKRGNYAHYFQISLNRNSKAKVFSIERELS